MRARARRIRATGDRGVTVVFVAVGLVALLAVTGLAVDGGIAYAQRRTMQNAADSAAMAGTRMVDKIRFRDPSSGTPAPANSEILVAIERELGAQGADGASCRFVLNDAALTEVGEDFCQSPSFLGAVNLDTDRFRPGSGTACTTAETGCYKIAGVRVRSQDTRPLSFGAFLGADSLTASASATATIQPLYRTDGSPFIVCGRADLAPGNAWDILDLDDKIKPTALGAWFPLQWSKLPDCGAGNEFKGKGPDSGVALNTWVDGYTGNGFDAQILIQVSGLKPCPPAKDGFPPGGCGMLIPIARQGCGKSSSGKGPTYDCPPGVPDPLKPHLYVVTWTVWMVYGNGSSGSPVCDTNLASLDLNGSIKYCGQLLGYPPPAMGGGGGTGDVVDPSQARVLKLAR
ncbi:TadE/TadG family type IV pilus assembly protein [Rhabdothermincola sediminis]|uniref:TadE/TadG family type IV pilus assembly protein n=1 Tax=Rhabdothermincola sediminis TaxID=2751370 RepID=UPI001AA0A55F|nr:TadE/TadG family type IV pilus assembly protein [Rhabdothermincola sediminis]